MAYKNGFYITSGVLEGYDGEEADVVIPDNVRIIAPNAFKNLPIFSVTIPEGVVEIQAVGAGALNQAIKAVAIARGFVAPTGKNLICIPAFQDISIDGEERTAIKLIIEAK